LNAFFGCSEPEMTNTAHVMRESWEIGNDWEADRSNDANSLSADTRPSYMCA